MELTELLNFAIANGMLDASSIGNMKAMVKHNYKIYQGRDGYWYTYVRDTSKKTGRRQVKRGSKDAINRYLDEFYADTSPTIEEAFNDWNKRRLELGVIKNSTYTRNEQIFKRHFEKISGRKISKMFQNDLTEFLEEQVAEHNLSARAFSNLKSVTKGVFKRARKQGWIFYSVDQALADVDVSERAFKRQQHTDAEEVFYDEEMEDILSYCYTHRDDVNCLGVALMFVSGLRVGEVVALKSIDILDDAVLVRRTETRYRQDGHMVFEVADYPKTPAGVRKVFVPDKYRWVLEELKKHGSEYIFIGKNGNRLHTQAVRKRVYQICKRIDIPVRSPHKIRKTYGSILLDNRLDDKLIQKQMGHTDVSCTRQHYYRDRKHDDEKREAINSIPQFE